MATSKKASATSPKKQLRKSIAQTLETTFPDLKKQVGDKQFEKQIKKASKVLAAGAKTNQPAKSKTIAPAKKKAAIPSKKKTAKK